MAFMVAAPVAVSKLNEVEVSLNTTIRGKPEVVRLSLVCLLARGQIVSGSDAKDSTTLAALRALGATIHIGHRAENVADTDTVVISTAIRDTNPELAEARRRGLRVIPRAAALAAVMSGRRAVAVAGTSGKTTTTSMLTVATQRCGVDPSFAIGGDLNESGSNAHHGSGDLFIAEADESDGSFLLLSPDAAIVTNIEVDHLDQHGTREAYAGVFDDFLQRISPSGVLVCCADDPGTRRLATVARGLIATVRTYGESADADLRLICVEQGCSLLLDLVARRVQRRFAESGKETPGQSKAAKEQDGIDGVASHGVPKVRNSGDVAGEQSGAGARVGKTKRPDSEIGDQEKLSGAQERGCADAENGSTIREEAADEHVEEKAGVDDGDELVKADEDVSRE